MLAAGLWATNVTRAAPVSFYFDDLALAGVVSELQGAARGAPYAPLLPGRCSCGAGRASCRVHLPVDTDSKFVLPEFIIASIVERCHVGHASSKRTVSDDHEITGKQQAGLSAHLWPITRVTAFWLPNHCSGGSSTSRPCLDSSWPLA